MAATNANLRNSSLLQHAFESLYDSRSDFDHPRVLVVSTGPDPAPLESCTEIQRVLDGNVLGFVVVNQVELNQRNGSIQKHNFLVLRPTLRCAAAASPSSPAVAPQCTEPSFPLCSTFGVCARAFDGTRDGLRAALGHIAAAAVQLGDAVMLDNAPAALVELQRNPRAATAASAASASASAAASGSNRNTNQKSGNSKPQPSSASSQYTCSNIIASTRRYGGDIGRDGIQAVLQVGPDATAPAAAAGGGGGAAATGATISSPNGTFQAQPLAKGEFPSASSSSTASGATAHDSSNKLSNCGCAGVQAALSMQGNSGGSGAGRANANSASAGAAAASDVLSEARAARNVKIGIIVGLAVLLLVVSIISVAVASGAWATKKVNASAEIQNRGKLDALYQDMIQRNVFDRRPSSVPDYV